MRLSSIYGLHGDDAKQEISNYYVHIVQENVCLPHISALSLILEHKTLFQPDSEKVILILCYYISLKDRS